MIHFIIALSVLCTCYVSSLQLTTQNSSNCFSNRTYAVADSCTIVIGVKLNAREKSSLKLEVIAYDEQFKTFVTLCVPKVKIVNGTFNQTYTQPNVSMFSHSPQTYSNEFDALTIDFGNISAANVSSYFEVSIDVIIIDRGQSNNSRLKIFVNGFNTSSFNITQFSLTYVDKKNSHTPVFTYNYTKFDNFSMLQTNKIEYSLSTTNIKQFSVYIYANSSYSDLIICSIHIQEPTQCYPNLNNYRKYTSSNMNKDGTLSLYLDSVYDVCTNRNKSASESKITFGFIYKLLNSTVKNHIIGSNLIIGLIENKTNHTFSNSTVNVTSVTSTSVYFNSSQYKIVSVALEKNEFRIYESFNITITIDFYQPFHNDLRIEIASSNTTIVPRMKLCSFDILYSGDELPCKKCLEITHLTNLSRGLSIRDDRMGWVISKIQLNNVSSIKDYPNRLVLSVMAQVLDQSICLYNVSANFTVEIFAPNVSNTMGTYLKSFKINDTECEKLNFSINYGDRVGYKYERPRIIYYDIYTKPKSGYYPSTISIYYPNVPSLSSETITMCRVDVIYMGPNIGCYDSKFVLNSSANYDGEYFGYVVDLNSFCNIALNQTNDTLGLVRLRFSIRVNYAFTLSNIAFYVEYKESDLYYNELMLEETNVFNYSFAGVQPVVFTKKNISTISNSEFGLAKLYIKAPSWTHSLYETKITMDTIGLKSGTASLIKSRVTKIGTNIPCGVCISEGYDYMNNNGLYVRSVDRFTTFISTIDQEEITSFSDFDNDTVEFEIITKAYANTLGNYSINVQVLSGDGKFMASQAIGWIVVQDNKTIYEKPFVQNVSIFTFTVDNFSTPIKTFYRGQDILLRYNLTLKNTNCFNITIYSALKNKTYSQYITLKNMFLVNASENYPSAFVAYSEVKNLLNTYMIQLTDICYFNLSNNINSSNYLTIEAHYRVAMDLPDMTGKNITILMCTTQNCTNSTTDLQSTLPYFNKVNNYSVDTYKINVSYSNLQNLTANYIYSYVVEMTIPVFSIMRLAVRLEAFNKSVNISYANITGINIYAGSNVQSFLDEYLQNRIKPVYSSRRLTQRSINEGAYLDLGVITNNGWRNRTTYLTSNSVPADKIYIVYLIAIKNDLNINFLIKPTVYYNLTSAFNISDQHIFDVLLGQPSLKIESKLILNAINSTQMQITFKVDHLTNSTATAKNISVFYYLPLYLNYTSILCKYGRKPVIQNVDKILEIKFPTELSFLDVEIDCTINVKIVNENIDRLAEMHIPYNITYKARYDNLTDYASIVQYLIYNYTTLTSDLDNCQISSLSNTNTEYLALTFRGWQSDIRPIEWYKSGSNYIKISFGNLTLVDRILLSQLTQTTAVMRFTIFQISYSIDDKFYIFLPERFFPTTDFTVTYELRILSLYCRYLRIHIKNVSNPELLTTKTTGLIITKIIGFRASSDVSVANLCSLNNSQSTYYHGKSIAVVNYTNSTYVCIEKINSVISKCFKQQNISNRITWEILPKTVGNVILWLNDRERKKTFLFGLSINKKSFIRSDNNGMTWKSISSSQLEWFLNDIKLNKNKYLYAFYNETFNYLNNFV